MSDLGFLILCTHTSPDTIHMLYCNKIERYNVVKDTLASRKSGLVANGENLSLPLSPLKDRLLHDEVGNVCPGDDVALVTVFFDDLIRFILPALFVALALSVS